MAGNRHTMFFQATPRYNSIRDFGACGSIIVCGSATPRCVAQVAELRGKGVIKNLGNKISESDPQ